MINKNYYVIGFKIEQINAALSRFNSIENNNSILDSQFSELKDEFPQLPQFPQYRNNRTSNYEGSKYGSDNMTLRTDTSFLSKLQDENSMLHKTEKTLIEKNAKLVYQIKELEFQHKRDLEKQKERGDSYKNECSLKNKIILEKEKKLQELELEKRQISKILSEIVPRKTLDDINQPIYIAPIPSKRTWDDFWDEFFLLK